MNISLNKLICVSVALLILGWISPGESGPEKDIISGLMKRTAKSVTGLTLSEDGKVVKGKQRAIRRLRRLIKLSDTKLQKAALGDVVKRLKEGNLVQFPEPEFIPGAKFDFLIRYNGKKRVFSVTALKTAAEENKVIDTLFQQVRDALRGGVMERNIRFFPEVNVIRISVPVFPEEPVADSLVLSSAGAGTEMYPGVILIRNRIEETFVKDIQPLAKKYYTTKAAKNISVGSLIRNVFLRHAAHYSIPVEIEAEEKERRTKISGLKELLTAAEEVRADLTYLALIARMSEKALVEDQLKEEVLLTFILQKLAEIKSSGETSPSGALLASVYARGGIKVGKNGKKLVIEMDLLTRSIKSLESRFAALFSKGSYTECAAFFKNNNEVPLNIKELISIPGQKGTE